MRLPCILRVLLRERPYAVIQSHLQRSVGKRIKDIIYIASWVKDGVRKRVMPSCRDSSVATFLRNLLSMNQLTLFLSVGKISILIQLSTTSHLRKQAFFTHCRRHLMLSNWASPHAMQDIACAFTSISPWWRLPLRSGLEIVWNRYGTPIGNHISSSSGARLLVILFLHVVHS